MWSNPHPRVILANALPTEIATGFDDAGASAAEIKTPSEIYPKAFFGAKNDDS